MERPDGGARRRRCRQSWFITGGGGNVWSYGSGLLREVDGLHIEGGWGRQLDPVRGSGGDASGAVGSRQAKGQATLTLLIIKQITSRDSF
jgi:hypothetical protein